MCPLIFLMRGDRGEQDLAFREAGRRIRIVHIYGSALADALIKEGWIPEALPGETVNLDKGGIRFMPFDYAGQLADGKMAEERWRELCREAGISDLRFGF
jgi:hypothetical protein